MFVRKNLYMRCTVTKDLSNASFGLSNLPATLKTIFLVSGLTVAVASPVVYITSKEKPQDVIEDTKANIIGDVESAIPDNLMQEFSEDDSNTVMQEGFFSQGEEIAEENTTYSKSPKKEEPISYEQDPAEYKGPNGVRSGSFFVDSNPPPSPVHNASYKSESPAIPRQPIDFSTGNKSASKSKGETRYINHEEEDKNDDVAELLADKDYPSTIASKPHDLSRILTTDSFIPAVMYTALNSEIPSKTVLAIVESDVAGFHGDNILIPKGSKVEGTYEAIANKHARRMQITWFKITRPDGVIIKLDGESSDMQGAGGMGGYLDQRLKDRYGGALLLSTINAMAQMSVRENDIRQLAAVESFGREFGTLTAQVIRENINAMPIIMIRQGTRFNIRPYQNIYFPKPKNKAVKALFINANQ